MSELITYKDKKALTDNVEIDEVYKVTAKNMNEIKKVVNNAVVQIDDIVENQGSKDPSNIEVVQARGGFKILNDRLNNSDEIKASKEELENSISELNLKIQSVSSGSPLVANSINDMTDTSRIYVLTTNGHWYYYNGSNWIDGGIYQATEVADGSITEEKTSFYKINANKFIVKNSNSKGYNIIYDNETGITKITGTVSGTGGVEVSRFSIDATINFKYIRQAITSINTYVKLYNINDLSTAIKTFGGGVVDDEIELQAGTYAIYIQANMNTILNEQSRFYLIPKSIYNSQNIINKLNLYKVNYYNEHANNLNKDMFPFENLLIAHLINPSSNYAGKLDLVNKQITIQNDTRILFSYLLRNKKVTQYTNMRTIKSDFTSTINLINNTYPNSLYYICLDYSGNLLSIPDSLFATQNNNYFIIAVFVANNGNIVSYNTFGNKFNVVGGTSTDTDFSNMSLVCIGDSLTYPGDSGPNALNPKYPEIVKNILGLGGFTNCGLSGSTVANNPASPSTPMSNDSRMASYPNADIIIIGGGYNDYGNSVPLGNLGTTDETTFYGGYKKLLNYLITNNPTSTIIVMITPMANSTPTSAPNSIGLKKIDYIEAIKEIARYFSVPLLDMNQLGSLGQFNKATWTNDGLHFKQQYVNKIYAPRIANFIKTLF